MASYTKVSNTVPLNQRTALIENVEAGDQIDIVDILGRPARGAVFVTTSATDVVEYRLNTLMRVRRSVETAPDEIVKTWVNDSPVFSNQGSTFQTVEGLPISSIDVGTLTLSSGTTISIVVF